MSPCVHAGRQQENKQLHHCLLSDFGTVIEVIREHFRMFDQVSVLILQMDTELQQRKPEGQLMVSPPQCVHRE